MELLGVWDDEVVALLYGVLEQQSLYGEPGHRDLASMALRTTDRVLPGGRVRDVHALLLFVHEYRRAVGTQCLPVRPPSPAELLDATLDATEDWRLLTRPRHGSRVAGADTGYEWFSTCSAPSYPALSVLYWLVYMPDDRVQAHADIVAEQGIYGLDPEAHESARAVVFETTRMSLRGRSLAATTVLAFVDRLRQLDGAPALPRSHTLTNAEAAEQSAGRIDRWVSEMAAKRGTGPPPPTDVDAYRERLDELTARHLADPERYAGEEGMRRLRQEMVDELLDSL